MFKRRVPGELGAVVSVREDAVVGGDEVAAGASRRWHRLLRRRAFSRMPEQMQPKLPSLRLPNPKQLSRMRPKVRVFLRREHRRSPLPFRALRRDLRKEL